MRKIFGSVATVLVAGFLLFMAGTVFALALSTYQQGQGYVGAYLYEGEDWVDEVVLVGWMATYDDDSFDVKEVAPNTALVRYRFITVDDLPGLDRRVLDGGDMEVYALKLVSYVVVIVIPVVIVIAFLEWRRTVKQDDD